MYASQLNFTVKQQIHGSDESLFKAAIKYPIYLKSNI